MAGSQLIASLVFSEGHTGGLSTPYSAWACETRYPAPGPIAAFH